MDYLNLIPGVPPQFFPIILLWSILWKGLGLYRSARLEQRNWFVALLVINTLGILDILYLFFFANKKMKLEELYFWNQNKR